MKVNKVGEYSPGYPNKKGAALKIGAVAAAAVLAVGTAGCGPRAVGFMVGPDPTETPVPEGEPVVDVSEAPDFPEYTGEPLPISTETVTEAPVPAGDIVVDPGAGD